MPTGQPEVVIVEAVRTPVGKRKGGLSTLHPAETLAAVQRAAVERAGIDPSTIEQVVAGCVSQVGEQAFDIGRASPPPPSTPSAGRPSRPPAWPPPSSPAAWSTWPWRAVSSP
jgi:hypothetical protein